LIVVVALIGVLIFLLFPATSRRPVSRLSPSCSANLRNLVYGALYYANDWKDVLPSFSPGDVSDWNDWNTWFSEANANRRNLHTWSRLPIVGFDTTTSVNPVHRQQGGLAIVMRDYLKSDWDTAFCLNGWFEKGDNVVRDSPKVTTGTLYLGHRAASKDDVGNPHIDVNIPRLASDPATWVLFTDMTIITGTAIADPLHIASNHFDKKQRNQGSALPDEWPQLVNLDPMNNKQHFPPGGNVGRLDGKTSWFAWESFQPRYYFEFQSRPARYWWGAQVNTKSKSW
jgi:hypothetical protein